MPSTQNGRRGGDFWSRAGKIIAVLLAAATVIGAAGKGYLIVNQVSLNAQTIVLHNERLTVLEAIKVDDHYMTCYMFQKVNPDGVPASCELALRHK